MTIKGLTDNVLPAFPRIGKLRKGSPRDADGKIGKEQSFWRFASERPEVSAAFMTAYGEQPVAINVYLPYATVEDCFSSFVEEWTAGGLVHRCDGETMLYWRTPAGSMSDEPKACPYFTGEKTRSASSPGCKPVGRLTVILPELVYAGFVGYVTMETHSLNDLLSIQASLLAVAEARMSNAMGLRGVPFVLRRAPELISTPGTNGQRVRRKKYLVKLEPLADWVAIQIETSRRLAFGDERRLALPDGRHVDTATGEVDDAEEGDWEPDEGDDDGGAGAAHGSTRTGTDEHARPAEAHGNGYDTDDHPTEAEMTGAVEERTPVSGKTACNISKAAGFTAAATTLIDRLEDAGIHTGYKTPKGYDFEHVRYTLFAEGYPTLSTTQVPEAMGKLEARILAKAKEMPA